MAGVRGLGLPSAGSCASQRLREKRAGDHRLELSWAPVRAQAQTQALRPSKAGTCGLPSADVEVASRRFKNSPPEKLLLAISGLESEESFLLVVFSTLNVENVKRSVKAEPHRYGCMVSPTQWACIGVNSEVGDGQEGHRSLESPVAKWDG